MKRLYVALWILAAGMVGCSTKQYFEPSQTFETEPQRYYEGNIVHVGREGVTLDNGHYIAKEGISDIVLDKGFHFVNEDKRYVIAANAEGVLRVVDKRNGKVVTEETMPFPLVAASVHRGFVAYILENNLFGLYKLGSKKRVMESYSEPTFAIDARAANPLFVDTLAVMPMLDGKLVIFDVYEPENLSVIYLSSGKNFNNVVFLDRSGDTLVAATPKKLLSIGDAGEFEVHDEIADVAVYKGSVFLFTKDGRIDKLSLSLDKRASRKFKFAQFAATDVYKGKVYALDKQGSLIVLDTGLKKTKIYDVGEVESPVFMRGGKLYKEGKIIDLTQLSYE